MSLILEALRKSEAERRRGLAPDLFVELPPTARRRDSGLTTALWWALAVAAVAIAAWLTHGRWRPTQRADAAVATTVPDAASRQPSRDRSAAPPVRTDAVPGSVGNIAAPPLVTDALPSAEVPATPEIAPAPRPAPTTPDGVAAVPGRSAAIPPPDPVREPLPPQANPQAASPPTTAPPASDNAATLQLADLPAEQRKQLPPLRISMHMWDQNPARRFVIIDGARLGEGDRIGDAVIEQITPDSVLLDWNGRRLRLPVLR